MTSTVTMHIGDVRDVLAAMIEAGDTVDQAVTSPPFLALRSYLPADHPDKQREIGSEPTPAAFLDTLLALTEQLGRVVAEWGSVCVELGDTMSGSGGAGGDYGPGGLREGQGKFDGSGRRNRPADVAAGILAPTKRPGPEGRDNLVGWPLAKSMCLLPHSYTIGLAYGHNPLTGTPSPAGRWRIRNVICWARPNPPVGSLGKRNTATRTGDQKFRPATSYITVACRGTGRYFDLDAVRYQPAVVLPDAKGNNVKGSDERASFRFAERVNHNPAGAPPLDWHADDLDGDWLWKLATAPYKGSHFATFPLTLPRRLILAMCPQRVCDVCGLPSERIVSGELVKLSGSRGQKAAALGNTTTFARTGSRTTTLGWTDCGHDAWRPGRVLDPFGGSGTTAVAAALENRDAVLIDIDARNIDLVRRRLTETVRILNETRTGDTVTWTVETVTPTELAADHAGQPSLFGDVA